MSDETLLAADPNFEQFSRNQLNAAIKQGYRAGLARAAVIAKNNTLDFAGEQIAAAILEEAQ